MSSSDAGDRDRLERLRGHLTDLDDRELDDHPRVLDEVHRALVGELDRLAGPGGADAAG